MDVQQSTAGTLARTSVIRLCWPLSFVFTLLFCAVLLVLFTNGAKPYSWKQTLYLSRHCDKKDSFCQVQHLFASLRSLFQMWAIAVIYFNAKVCGDRCTVYYWATHISYHLNGCSVSGWIPLLTCGDDESNPGPEEGQDYP